jgi:hypothetical protein
METSKSKYKLRERFKPKPSILDTWWGQCLALAGVFFGFLSFLIGPWIIVLGILQLALPSFKYLAYDSNNWLCGIGFFIMGTGLILTSFRIYR